MANESNRVIARDGSKGDRGLNGKPGHFKRSAPANYVRPKPVPVPAKSK